MRITTRYLLQRCLIYVSMLLIIFAILYVVITLITSGNINNKFSLFSAIYYLSLSVPSIIYTITPIAVLVGVELALISLVSNSEYVIIRVNGISLIKIMQILFVVGSIFACATFLIGEFVAPASNNLAGAYKMHKTNSKDNSKVNSIYNLASGIWIHDGESNFVNIKSLDLDKNVLYNIAIYSYSPDMQIMAYKVAKSATYDNNIHKWILHDFVVKTYVKELNKAANYESYSTFTWNTTLRPEYFRVFVKSPENMSIADLARYLHLPNVDSNAQQEYKVLFWHKIFYPFYCIIMALIALIFIPNNRRNVNLANKVLLGVVTGLGLYVFIKLISRLAVSFELNAFIFQLLPVLILFLLCGLILKFKK